MQAINNVLSRLKDFEGLEDGTYDYFTKSIVSFDDGYQVTFHNCDKDYTIEEYDGLVKNLMELTNSKLYIGVYGSPEASFYCKEFKLAKDIAEKYNQYSMWGWFECTEIENPQYDSSKGNKIKGGEEDEEVRGI